MQGEYNKRTKYSKIGVKEMKQHGHHRFNPGKAGKLIDPNRQEIFPIEEVLTLMDIKEHEVVADLGCGNGYLSIPILNKANHLFAVDIEPKMLELLRERVNETSKDNISYINSDLEQINIIDKKIDKAVVAFVAHEIPNLEKAIAELKRILKTNGVIFVIDWEAIDMENGPPKHERIPSEKLHEIFEDNGFVVELGHFNKGVYYLKAELISASEK